MMPLRLKKNIHYRAALLGGRASLCQSAAALLDHTSRLSWRKPQSWSAPRCEPLGPSGPSPERRARSLAAQNQPHREGRSKDPPAVFTRHREKGERAWKKVERERGGGRGVGS